MKYSATRLAAVLISAAVLGSQAWAIDGSVPRIHGDLSRSMLGDGTGVVIAFVDSGVDDTHPSLAGVDTLSQPRMKAEANFVPGEFANTGDDVFGHGTWVASAAMSRHPVFTGLATNAQLINARVLNNNNFFADDPQVRNGIGYAVQEGANIINLSLNYFAPNNSGDTQLDLMIDWAAYAMGVHTAACCGNISQGTGGSQVRGPGSAYNAVTVGYTTADFSRVHSDSATAFTSNFRMKPDVVAPGSALTLANDDWEGAANDWDFNLGGCSFAAPHVAGMMAQQLEAGAVHGLSTSPLVIKATMMTSAEKILNKLGNPWQPSFVQDVAGVATIYQPLDIDSGAGQIDGLALSTQYLAGEMPPGMVADVGWDLHDISADQVVDYAIDQNLVLGSTLTATLTWFRHVDRIDDGNGLIDSADSYLQSQGLSDLNLQILRNGNPISASLSSVDNVEHLRIVVDQHAQYALRVIGLTVIGPREQFALAWYGTAVPQPGSLPILVLGASLVLLAGVRRISAIADPSLRPR